MDGRHDFDAYVCRRGTDSKKYSEEFYPENVIPMWIADTDFKSPEPVIEALIQRAQHGIFGYTPPSARLRRAVAGWEARRFDFQIQEDAVEFVPGVISGVIAAIRALSRAGDKVIIQTPSYPPFAAGIENNGRRVLRNPLVLKGDRYTIDFDQLELLCREDRAKLFILCNPHNPSGRVFTREELQRIGEICLRNHIIILADEIHCDLVYPGYHHTPFASLSPEFAVNTITFVSPSKTFNLPGFRTAAMICTEPRLKKSVHDVLVSNKAIGENIFGTLALCTAYEQCDYYVDQLIDYLDQNRQLLADALSDQAGIRLVRAEGTYLMWLDCRGLNMTQSELMDTFVNNAGVGVQSGTEFGTEGLGFVRMNIGCPRATLRQAVGRLKTLFEPIG